LFSVGVSSNFINVLRGLFSLTSAAVSWEGERTDFFNVHVGVRQGCPMSPLLFSLFINDVVEELEGGVKVGEVKIKALLYADDIVLVSDSVTGLQLNINHFARYCERWSLRVNLSKSKVMVFRRGGRISRLERWKYEGEVLETVNEYRFLGVTLSSKLSFASHLRRKIVEAKHGVNSLWKTILIKEQVPLSAKYEIYLSIFRSLTCYGSQVWGVYSFEILEAFQRYFIKRLFSIPQCTPNYLIALETELPPLFYYTLKSHVKYILRTLELPGHRLPKILAELSIARNAPWFREWSLIADRYGGEKFREQDRQRWHEQWATMRDRMEKADKEAVLTKGLKSERFLLYRRLLEVNPEYRPLSWHGGSSLTGSKSRWLLKLRGELLYLNKRPWENLTAPSTMCSLCNLNVEEDSFHFIGVCPILGNLRQRLCGKATLSREEIIDFLSGNQADHSLLLYARSAWQERYSLVRQFNFR